MVHEVGLSDKAGREVQKMTMPACSQGKRCGGCKHLRKWNEMEKMTMCWNKNCDHYAHFIHFLHPADDCYEERKED